MAVNRTAPRRKTPTIEPFTLAVLTGKPLPNERLSPFRADYLTHIDRGGLLAGVPSFAVPFTQLWKDFHGHAMTPAERRAVEARFPEIEAQAALARRPVAATTVEEGSDQ